MSNALNVNSSVGLFFKDWVPIVEGETLEYEVSLYEDADLDKVMSWYICNRYSCIYSTGVVLFFRYRVVQRGGREGVVCEN